MAQDYLAEIESMKQQAQPPVPSGVGDSATKPAPGTDYLGEIQASQEVGNLNAPADSPDASTPKRGFLKDVGVAVVGGAEAAVRGTVQTATALGNAYLEYSPLSMLAQKLTGKEAPKDLLEDPTKIVNPIVPEPDRLINQIAKTVVQFGIGYVAGGQLLKGVETVGTAAKVGKAVLQTEAGVGLVADAHQARLSNFIEQYPSLQNPLTEWLAADPNDAIAEGKFKTMIEDVMLLPVGAAMFKILKATKNLIAPTLQKAAKYAVEHDLGLPKTKAAQAAEAVTEEVTQTIKQLQDDVANGKVIPERFPQNVIQPNEGKVALDVSKGTHPDYVFHGSNAEGAESFAKQGAANVEPGREFFVSDIYDYSRGMAERRGGKVFAIKKSDLPENLLDEYGRVKPGTRVPLHQLDPKAEGESMVYLSRNEMEAATKKGATLDKLAGQAGGEERLAGLAAKNAKADEMFTLKPEQYTEFTKRMSDDIAAGRVDYLFAPLNGAWNYARMQSPADTLWTLKHMTEVMQPQLEANIGKIQPFREMQATANLLGIKPDTLLGNLRLLGVQNREMAPTIIAAKNWIQSLSTEITSLARQEAISGLGGDSARVELMRRIDLFKELVGLTKGAVTGMARGTAAGNIRTSARYTPDQMLKMIEEAGGYEKLHNFAAKLALAEGDPNAIRKLVDVSWQRKLLDSHNEYWINSILSGVKTHMVNVSSTLTNTMVKPANIIAGGIMRREWGDVKAGLSLWKGLGTMSRDSLSMARRAFQTESPLLSQTARQVEIERTISAANYNLDPNTWLGQGVNWLGKAVRMPSRFLGTEDEFFKQMTYRAKAMLNATDEAMEQVKAGKLSHEKMIEAVGPDGKAVKISEFEKYIDDSFAKKFEYEVSPDTGQRIVQGEQRGPGGVMQQGKALDENALQYANESTFTQSLAIPHWDWTGSRTIGESIQALANTHPVVRGTVLPFVKVPANLMREFMSYTPGVAQMRKQFWADMAEGGVKKSESIGKMATGSLLWTTAAMLAAEGSITGAPPMDPAIRASLDKEWRPYSFVTDNGDGTRSYTPFQRFDPYGMFFGLAADYVNVTHNVNENVRNNLAANLTMALASNLNSKGYLKGLVDLADTVSGGRGDRKAQHILEQKASSYIPSLLQVANPNDELKQIRGVMDAMVAKIPGYSADLPAKRGYLGEPRAAQVGYPWSAINPYASMTTSGDPVEKELARLALSPAQAQFEVPNEKLGSLDLVKFKTSTGKTAYDLWQENIGKSGFKEKLADLIETERYKGANDGDSFYHTGKRVDMIRVQQQKYRDKALKETLNTFEEEFLQGKVQFNLKEMVLQDKQNAKAVRHGRDASPIDRLLEFSQ